MRLPVIIAQQLPQRLRVQHAMTCRSRGGSSPHTGRSHTAVAGRPKCHQSACERSRGRAGRAPCRSRGACMPSQSMVSTAGGAPKGHCAVAGDLHAVEAHDDVARAQRAGRRRRGRHAAHQHALLPGGQAVRRAQRRTLHALPLHAQRREARVAPVAPAAGNLKMRQALTIFALPLHCRHTTLRAYVE